MDGHQFRGARIYRDMMLVSSVCRRAVSVVSGGGDKSRTRTGFLRGKATKDI